MRRSASALGALLLGHLAACAGGEREAAEVLLLAKTYAPHPWLSSTSGGGRACPAVFDVFPPDWQPQPGNLWRARAPWYSSWLPVLPDEPATLTLEGGLALEQVTGGAGQPVLKPGEFCLQREEDGDYVLACLAEGAPRDARLKVSVSAGRPDERGWRIEAGPLAGDGFVVHEDAPVEITIDVPPRSELVFHLLILDAEDQEPVTLRLRFNGEIAGELKDQMPWPMAVSWPKRIALPPGGLPRARLSIEVVGDAYCALIEPRIAPLEPSPPARPDIVVFLADTFRADNLDYYGGTLSVTPELDAFARECLRFRRAWAPSCWTLPSHASFFFGAYPPQHGAVAQGLTPGAGLVSIAERLRSSGYRTAAVTDSLFVSRRFGLDRGFEHFEEYSHRDLERTLERARVLGAEQDGRPLFLFVHTYRTHEPYEVSAETLAELGQRLGIDTTWDKLKAQVFEAAAALVQSGDTEVPRLMQEGDFQRLLAHLGIVGGAAGASGEAFLHDLRALYLGGVRDLDRGFRRFLDDLAARPRAPDTWLFFTSDHGEAFHEHASFFHGAGAYEENLRVPLLIRGPDLAPADVPAGVSLVSLPQTIAAIAGVAPDPRWLGEPLISAKAAGPVFAFDCAQRGDPSAVVVEQGIKVFFPPEEAALTERRIVRAFDLDADPAERTDLSLDPRSRATLNRNAEQARKLLQPLVAPGAAELNASERRRLEAMGYTGEGR
jgi:arylsulfatase